jgi:UDP-glucose:(heptosyl)LPS alpha-1,3-glucosyltransferase
MNNELYIVRRNSGQGGAERVAERLAQNFSDQFDVYRLWAGTHFQGQIIPGKKGPPWWRSWKYSSHINQLPIFHKHSVVYSLEYGPNCDIYRAGDGIHRLNVLRRYGNNKSWMVNPWHWYAPKLERNSFESSRYIIANSKLVRSHIIQTYPHVANKIHVIYNGFDNTIFKLPETDKKTLRQLLGLPENSDKILLLSGSGFERKGLHHAIELLAQLHQNNCKAHLVVVGKGNTAYVKSSIKNYNLEEYIIFKGMVKNVAQYYQAADIMVLLTRYDPFSNATLEALACGCPTITTSNNGAKEIMTPATGLVIDAKVSPSDIQQCVDIILNKNFQAQQIAKSVLHLSAENEKKAHLNIINRVLEEKAKDDHI